MFTEFHGFPKPDPNFNLFYLEPSEFLITSIHCSLHSEDFQFTEGKLHLCTRSLIFQPSFFKAPLLKIKLSNPDLTYSFKLPSAAMVNSPNSKARKSINDRSVSPFNKFDSVSLFTISVPRCICISRYPPCPGKSLKLEENLEFRMNQNDLLKLSTELDMVGRSGEEKHVAQIIFGVRYKELVAMLLNTEDFNPDDILLNHKCKRILPEGEQWGAFVLTQTSLHFYVLMNSKPKSPLHISFQDISICTKYKYQSKSTGLRIDLFSSPWPLVFIFETEEQKEGIHKFILNKIKFKNPLEMLAEYSDQWSYGRLSNFEYLMVINNLSNRSSVDFSQYPVFPWIISKYQSTFNLSDPNFFRDLGKHIGELESSRYQRLKLENLQQDRGENLYSEFFSNPSIINYFFIRSVPELLVRNQNQVFFNTERLFTSIEKSWNSGVKATGDYKELSPEFYSTSAFLCNLREMQAIGDETLCDVELPEWSKNAENFIELMRDALESDFVSSNLHKWIDLVFGFRQKEESCGLFPETCYGVNWGTMKTSLVKEAYEVVCREFGQFPEAIFYIPHQPRIFRKLPTLYPPPEMADQGVLLEKYLNTLQEMHQSRINNMLEQYSKSKKKNEQNRLIESEILSKQILSMKDLIQKLLEDNCLEAEESGLQSQNSQDIIKSKSPNLPVKLLGSDLEINKARMEAGKKPRKLQSKTPTKNF